MITEIEPSAWFPAATGLAGVVMGGLISLFGTEMSDRRREKSERRNFSRAVAGEIEAALHVENECQYRSLYWECLEQIRTGKRSPMPNIGYEWDGGRSIYYRNLDKIGLLPPEISGSLIRCYQVYQTVVADRQAMDRGEWDKQNQKQRTEMLEKHIQVYDSFTVLCGEVLGKLRALYI